MIRVLVLLLLMSCAPTTPPPPESLVTLNLTNWAWDVVRVELQCRSNGRRLVAFPIVDKGTKASRRFNPRACDQAIPVVGTVTSVLTGTRDSARGFVVRRASICRAAPCRGSCLRDRTKRSGWT